MGGMGGTTDSSLSAESDPVSDIAESQVFCVTASCEVKSQASSPSFSSQILLLRRNFLMTSKKILSFFIQQSWHFTFYQGATGGVQSLKKNRGRGRGAGPLGNASSFKFEHQMLTNAAFLSSQNKINHSCLHRCSLKAHNFNAQLIVYSKQF